MDLPRSEGLESQLINEVCTSASWECSSVWTFRVNSHINILELSAVVRLVAGLVKKGKSLRLIILVDPNLVKCASAKGRSSSRALSSILSRLAALCVVGWISNWSRLVLLCLGPSVLCLCDRSVFRAPRFPAGLSSGVVFTEAAGQGSSMDFDSLWALQGKGLRCCVVWVLLFPACDRSVFRAPRFPAGLSSAVVLAEAAGQGSSMDFDSALGFPGEGPQVYLLGTVTQVRLVGLLLAVLTCGSHGVLLPRNSWRQATTGTEKCRPEGLC